MLEFAQAYPISPTSGQLTWSDYRELLSLNDAKQREEVSRKAASENWDTKQIRSEVKRINQKNRTGIEPVKRLIATPGKPGTYKVILAKEGPYAGELALDLGFSNYVRLAEAVENASHFKEGDVVQLASHFPKGGSRGISSATMRRLDAASGAQISPNPSLQKRGTEADLFTYEAYVYDVLDGDTVNAVVDLGFGFVTTQTLRLRGIDAPEIKTSDGIEAKKALEKMLGVSFPRKRESSSGSPIKTFGDDNKENPILIKTVKSDKYDRYLADVFVGDTYINQKLVEQGLAVIVDG
jgi:micrococcal nuclease